MRRVPVCVIAAALVLAGCSSHPLPENVTRETTFHITEKIRCEARQALDDLSVAAIRRLSDQPETLAFADQVEAGELRVVDLFDPKKRYYRRLDPRVKLPFQRLTRTAVTFDFAFT